MEHDEAKIQNNLGVAKPIMACTSQELEKVVKCGDMTVVKAAKEMLQEARKGTENLTCIVQKLLLNIPNYEKSERNNATTFFGVLRRRNEFN